MNMKREDIPIDKELLQQHLLSAKVLLGYYDDEIKDIALLQKIKEAELQKHVDSFIRFFPFQKGDILKRGNELILFDRVRNVYYDDKIYKDPKTKQISFYCYFKVPHGNHWSEEKSDKIYLDELHQYTIYRDSPVSHMEQLSSATSTSTPTY